LLSYAQKQIFGYVYYERTFGMKKIFLLLLVLIAAFAFASCGTNDDTTEEETGTEVTESTSETTAALTTATLTTTELIVSGMTCNNCVNAVRRAVEELSGVKSVSVTLSGGIVTVEYDSSLDVTAIKNSITALGSKYSVTGG
jgi:copper chaperone CopZ